MTTEQRDELAADRLDDERSADPEPESCDPAQQIVGDRCPHRPRGVRVEVSRGTVLEAGAFFEVPDGELDDRVTTMVGVEESGFTLAVESSSTKNGAPLGLRSVLREHDLDFHFQRLLTSPNKIHSQLNR